MINNQLITTLLDFLSKDEVQIITRAVLQNSLVCDEFNQYELNKLIALLPKQISLSMFNPATIGLSINNIDITLVDSLKESLLINLNPDLWNKSTNTLEKVLIKKHDKYKLQDALLVALSLNDLLKDKDKAGKFAESIVSLDYFQEDFIDFWSCVFACLINFQNEPVNIFACLLSLIKNPIFIEIISNAVLSNPLSSEETSNYFVRVFRGQKLPVINYLLNHLNKIGWYFLKEEIANTYIYQDQDLTISDDSLKRIKEKSNLFNAQEIINKVQNLAFLKMHGGLFNEAAELFVLENELLTNQKTNIEIISQQCRDPKTGKQFFMGSDSLFQFSNQSLQLSFEDVENLIKKGNLQEAFNTIVNLKKKIKTNADLFKLSAKLNMRLGDYQSALDDISISLLINPDEETKITAGRIYYFLNDYEKGFNLLDEKEDKLISISSDYLFAYFELAIKSGHYLKVINVCEKIDEKKLSTSHFSYLAEAQFALGQKIEALESIQKSLEIDRTNERAWLLLACLEEESSNEIKATEALLTAIKICPGSLRLHIDLIKKFSKKNNELMVKKIISKALQILPLSILDAEDFYKITKDQQLSDDAEKIITRAIQNWPRSNLLKLHYAEKLLEDQRFLESKELLEDMHNSGELNSFGLILYFFSHIKSNHKIFPFTKNKTDLDINSVNSILKTIKENSADSFWVNFLNAEIKFLEKNFAGALNLYTDLIRNLEILPGEHRWKVQVGMARALMANNEIDTAIVLLNETIKVYPDLQDIYFLLANAFEKKGLFSNVFDIVLKIVEKFNLSIDLLDEIKSFLLRIDRVKEFIARVRESNIEINKCELLHLYLSSDSQSTEESQDLLKKCLLLKNLQIDQALILVKLMIQENELEKAINYVSTLVSSGGEHPLYNFILGCLLRRCNRYEESFLALDKSSIIIPKDLLSNLKMELIVSTHDIEKIEMGLNEIELEERPRINLTGEYLKYRGIDHQFLPKIWWEVLNSPDSIFLLLADEFFRTGNLNKAEEFIDKAKKINPTSINLKYLQDVVRKAYLLDDFEDIVTFDDKEFSQMKLERESSFVDYVCLQAEIALQKKQEVLAASILSQILPENEENVRIKALQARLLFREGDFINSDRLLNEVDENAIAFLNNKMHKIGASDVTWIIEAALDLSRWDVLEKYLHNAFLSHSCLPNIIQLAIKYCLKSAINDDLYLSVSANNHIKDNFQIAQHVEKILNNPQEIKNSENPIIQEWKHVIYEIGNYYWTEKNEKFIEENAEIFAYLFRIFNKSEEYSKIINAFIDKPGVCLQACLYEFNSNPDESLRYAEQAIKADPTNPIPLVLKTLLLEKNCDYHAASKSLEFALSIWPNQLSWRLQIARLYNRVGNLGLAIEHLKYAYQADSKDVEVRNLLIQNLFLIDDFYNLKIIIEGFVNKNNMSFDEIMILAEIKFSEQNYFESEKLCEKAIQIDENSYKPYLLIAKIAIKRENIKQARENLDRVNFYSNKNPEAVILMAEIIEHQDGTAKALDYLDNNYLENKVDQAFIEKRADYIQKLKGDTESRKFLLMHEINGFPKLLTKLSLLEIGLGLIIEADVHGQESLNTNPFQPHLLASLGKMHQAEGNLDKSLKCYLDALVLEPNNIEHYLKLIELYLLRREFDDLFRLLDQGINKFPKEKKLIKLAGQIFWNSKNYSKAEEMFRQAAWIDPNDEEVRRQLGAVISINLITQNQETYQ